MPAAALQFANLLPDTVLFGRHQAVSKANTLLVYTVANSPQMLRIIDKSVTSPLENTSLNILSLRQRIIEHYIYRKTALSAFRLLN